MRIAKAYTGIYVYLTKKVYLHIFAHNSQKSAVMKEIKLLYLTPTLSVIADRESKYCDIHFDWLVWSFIIGVNW